MKRNRRSREGETYLIVLRRFSLIEFAGVVAYFVVLFLLSHLQYYHFRLRSVIYPLMWFSVAFVLYKVLFERSRERRGVLQLGGIIGFFVLLYYLIPLTGFCRYTDYGWFYVNEKDPTITIASRGYSCFMTDTDLEYVLERKITAHLKWISDLDVKHIDPATWRRLAN